MRYKEIKEGSLDGYYLYKDAEELWLKDNPGKTGRDFERVGVDVQDEYTEKAGGIKGEYRGKGVSNWTRKPKESTNPSLEALVKHIKEGVPLCDSIFRHHSESYLDTFKHAKQLKEQGVLPELDWESEEMLTLDIGESATLMNGETVWLDVPYMIEAESPNIADDMIGVPDNFYDEEERKEAYKDYMEFINPNSLEIIEAFLEPSLQSAKIGERFQFQRIGYFNVDDDSTKDHLVFNKTVGLRDSWAKSN